MKKYLYIISILLFFLFSTRAHASTYERLFYFTDSEKARASLVQNISKIDIFAPQVYGINKLLLPHGSLAPEINTIVRLHNVKIMPLITNDHFEQGIIHSLIASSTAQDGIIQFMVNEAKNNGYYGWQFDFEHIKSDDRDLFSSFVEKTAKIFKQNNLALSVALVVNTDTSNSTSTEVVERIKNWTGAFDYPRIANAADFLSVMTYDDPDSKGPTASIPFVANTLSYLSKIGVPPQKISMGIPTYYWSWVLASKPIRIRAGSYERLLSIKARTNNIEGFDTELGVPWLSFKEYGENYIVWFENQRSFKLKTDLMKSNNLRGYSVWVMGKEDPNIWNSV